MSEPISVLIVGAGPVGLTAALGLTQAGVAVRIVDAASGLDRRMRASTFHPPTLDMIASLGLATKLTRQGLKVRKFQMRQHETAERVIFDLAVIRDATDHPYRLQVEQHRYCELVIAALAQRGVDVKFDTVVDAVAQDEDGVTALLHTGSIRAHWLIGADGAASAVRKSLGLEYGGKTYTHSSVLVSTPFPFHDHLEDLSDVSYCWSDRGPYSLLRLRDFWRVSLYPSVANLSAAASRDRVRDWLAFIHDAMNLVEKLLQVLDGADATLLDQYHRQRHTLASQRIIPQASANRARMATIGRAQQLDSLQQHKAIAGDDHALRELLLQSSMISGLREAAAIA